jgi:hypothetical protein
VEQVLATLKDWQSLVGAIVGAFASLSVAFLVAYINRRREDRSAAMVLIGSLVNVRSAYLVLDELAKKENVSEADYPMWLAGRLASTRPKISPLFEGCVAKLMPVDAHLAAHLELFGIVYHSVEHHINKLVRDIHHFQEHGKLLREKKDAVADAKVIEHGLAKAAKYAECAEYLLSKLVLGNWPTLHRVKRLLLPSNHECNCKRLLGTGAH